MSAIPLLFLFAPSTAHADPPRDKPAPASVEGRWYGQQTLIVDGAVLAVGLLPMGAFGVKESARAPLAIGWYGAYALGTPIVHWAHGEVGKGAASLGLRVASPLAGTIAGLAVAKMAGVPIGSSDGTTSTTPGQAMIFTGAVLGLIAPVIIDAAIFARESPAPAPKADTGVRLTGGPTLLPGGGGLSAGGMF